MDEYNGFPITKEKLEARFAGCLRSETVLWSIKEWIVKNSNAGWNEVDVRWNEKGVSVSVPIRITFDAEL